MQRAVRITAGAVKGHMKLFWRRFVNWVAIVIGVMTLGFCVLLWRDDRRYEDFWSCKNESQARTQGRSNSSGGDRDHSIRPISAENHLIDDCMVKRGHAFRAGARLGRCDNERDNICYSVL
jgi:hypothetical protein